MPDEVERGQSIEARQRKRLGVEERKTQLLADLADTRERIVGAALAIPIDYLDEPFLGSWSVKDLLAHLIGWDLANLQAAADVLADQIPWFYEHHDRDWRSFNDRLIREHGGKELGELLAAQADSHARLLAYLRSIPADVLERDRGLRFHGWIVTIAKLLRAEAGDEQKHFEQIEGYRRAGSVSGRFRG